MMKLVLDLEEEKTKRRMKKMERKAAEEAEPQKSNK